MKKSVRVWIPLIIFLVTLTASFAAATSVGISVGNNGFQASFGNYLNPYGNWVTVPSFGSVWRPNAAAGWRPYSNGHWIYTSYGPTWEGAEPWASTAYHYGNWVY